MADIVQARNAEKCEKLLNKTPHDVAIPTIKWNMSSTRVLTMEFMEGCKINDLAALKKMNLEAKDVAKGIAEVFNHMIFIDGYHFRNTRSRRIHDIIY